MFKKFDQNHNFSKIWPKSKFFPTKIRHFSKMWPKSKFFGNFRKKSTFFVNFDQNRTFYENFTKIEFFFRKFDKIEIFSKFDQTRNCSKIIDQNEIFRKIWLKSNCFEIFANFDQNRNFSKIWQNRIFFEISKKSKCLSKISTKIEIFQKFEQNCLKIHNFSKNMAKIKIFRKFDQNRNFWKFSKKSPFFVNFE